MQCCRTVRGSCRLSKSTVQGGWATGLGVSRARSAARRQSEKLKQAESEGGRAQRKKSPRRTSLKAEGMNGSSMHDDSKLTPQWSAPSVKAATS